MRTKDNLAKLSRLQGPFRIICFVFCLVFVVGTAPADSVHGSGKGVDLLIFGDSLSDTGNAAVLGAGITFRPFENLIPDGPYFTYRFTNGRTWVEHLAKSVGSADSAKAAFLFSEVGRNYAVGGARARDFPDRVNLPQQVGVFLSSSKGALKRRDVIIIEFGGNDVRDAIVEFGDVLASTASQEAAQFAAAQILCQAVASIEDNIAVLHGAGGRNFLITNSPNLGITPGITTLESSSPGISILGAELSLLFNRLLLAGDPGICSGVRIKGLVALESERPGIDIVLFDVFELLSEVATDPEAFGLLNGTDACIRLNVFFGAICRAPGPRKYVFWDGIHPTGAMHRIVAGKALKLVDPKLLRVSRHRIPSKGHNMTLIPKAMSEW